MKNYLLAPGSASALLLVAASPLMAETDEKFTIVTDIEIGIESTISSDNPPAELTNAFATAEVAVEYALTGTVSLFAGVGDVKDQSGFAFGVVHAVNDQIELMDEVAYFDGFGGTIDSASYSTMGGTYTQGDFTYAASFTHRDVSNVSADHLISVGLDYTFANDITLYSGYSFAKEGGIDSHNIGLSVLIPIES